MTLSVITKRSISLHSNQRLTLVFTVHSQPKPCKIEPDMWCLDTKVRKEASVKHTLDNQDNLSVYSPCIKPVYRL